MVNDDIQRLSSEDAVRCLDRLVRGLSAVDSDVRALVRADSTTLTKAVAEATGAPRNVLAVLSSDDGEQRGEAARLLLLHMAADPRLEGRVAAALAADRAVLLEPVSTALLLSAIIIALSTHVRVKVENGPHGRKTEVLIEKKPTAAALIAKVMGIFK